MHKNEKVIKLISAVPIGSKFYGEFESDDPRIDLYNKIISFHKKMRSKWEPLGPLHRGSLRGTLCRYSGANFCPTPVETVWPDCF